MQLIATPCTSITHTGFYSIKTFLMAFRTFIILAIALSEDVLKTSIFIVEISVEVVYCVFHNYKYNTSLLVVKGYLRNFLHNIFEVIHKTCLRSTMLP